MGKLFSMERIFGLCYKASKDFQQSTENFQLPPKAGYQSWFCNVIKLKRIEVAKIYVDCRLKIYWYRCYTTEKITQMYSKHVVRAKNTAFVWRHLYFYDMI